MCRLKYGSEIKTERDVRNLVTGVIFRMNPAFKADDVKRETGKYMKGAVYKINKRNLYAMVDKEIADMYRFRTIIYKNGKYRFASSLPMM